jgi:phospholipid transport system substrate-binding protein
MQAPGFARRAVVRALLLGMVMAAPLTLSSQSVAAANVQSEGAADFIRTLGQQAIAELGDKSIPYDERVDQFSKLLNDGFAMDAISRFVLGRYWRVASDEEKQAFRKTFERVVMQRFLPLFEGYSNDDFVVEGAKQDPRNPDFYLVDSRIAQPGDKGGMVKAGWRVRHKSSDFEIVDVLAEGVSMAITLRSEYTSVIKRNGGRVSALTDTLEQKLARGAFKPESAQDVVQ